MLLGDNVVAITGSVLLLGCCRCCGSALRVCYGSTFAVDVDGLLHVLCIPFRVFATFLNFYAFQIVMFSVTREVKVLGRFLALQATIESVHAFFR